jgi:uncharacterized protein (DUF4415 family)
MSKLSKTDWDRIAAMSDEEIDTTDVPELSKSFFDRADLRLPRDSVAVTVNVDSDVLAWFQSQGEQCENRMNAALRIYAQAHKE